MSESVLSLWTVYCRPKDWPHGYIARRFEIHPSESYPTEDTVKADTLQELRLHMPEGMVALGRSPDDDPVIVEVWI